jgi:hypothetical protein
MNETNESGMEEQEQNLSESEMLCSVSNFLNSSTFTYYLLCIVYTHSDKNLLAEGQLAQWAGIAAKLPHCPSAET